MARTETGRVALFALLWSLALLGPAEPARAHTRSTSFSAWTLRPAADGLAATVRLRIPLLELTRIPPALLPAGLDPTGAYLARRLRLHSSAGPCVPTRPTRLAAPAGWAVYEWRLSCPAADGLELETSILLDVAPSHLFEGVGFTRLPLQFPRIHIKRLQVA